MNEPLLLNTLFVTTPGSYLRLDNDAVEVERDGTRVIRVPLMHLSGIVVFGHSTVTPLLIARCAEEGRALTWLDQHGQFCARISGPISGNVLLRKAQYATADDPARTLELARAMVAGKIQNCRISVLRSAREAAEPVASELRATADTSYGSVGLADALKAAERVLRIRRTDEIDKLRGVEGHAAQAYFATLGRMIRVEDERMAFAKRTRRPPRDPVNALLSFVYTLVVHDCASACETVGLDPQVGFLHALRPGRPALALDLMSDGSVGEELRAPLADRLCLTLINRRQVEAKDFETQPGGAVRFKGDARKTVLVAYQERKKEEIQHPVLERTIPLGLVPHVQARLLARVIRGDAEHYVPFTHR